ncbi:unnamed protein product [Phytophthora lilii]|uniref:Unnamed protein product n=1 Tax=Phytophthora lilii TaxID=2077276 RepID=A0A9W6YFH8_9STRA|nr:unnamed protein product [Phytophthora lilii]
MLGPLDISKDILSRVDKGLHFLGNVELRDDVVVSIASGQIHPVTHESYVWKDTSAAVLLEEQKASHPKPNRTGSSTSSESSGMVIPHRRQRQKEVAARNDSSQDDPVATTRNTRAGISRVRYEKPRPSSRSSWTHLDSVLGSSDHIVNFRSPKVSENFKPLAALHDISSSINSSSANINALKEFETHVVRDHVKRVRNPANRRRDGKGSGFEGEVLCRVDTPGLGTSSHILHNNAAGSIDVDRMTDEENAPPPQVKRPKLFGHSSSSPSSPSSRVSEASSEKLLVRPTPFGCGQRPPSSPTSSVSVDFNWKLPPRHSQQQQQRSVVAAPSNNSSTYTFAMSAEEKWDRILGDEIAVDSQADGQDRSSSRSSVDSSSSSGRKAVAATSTAL